MMEGHKELEIGTINNSAASEIFKRELGQVMDNIADINTESKATRKITIEFSFTPNEGRDMGVIEIKSKTSMAPIKSVGSTYVVRNNGKANMPYEANYHQPGLGLDNVSSIDNKSRAAGERDDD